MADARMLQTVVSLKDKNKLNLLGTSDFAPVDLKHATVINKPNPSPKDSKARVIISNKMIVN